MAGRSNAPGTAPAMIPEDGPLWILRLLMDLVVGAGAGALGAVARELGRIDREVTWLLIPLTIGGMALGAGVFVAAGTVVENEKARFAIAFFCGTLGQAAMTDMIRSWLRSMLPQSVQHPTDARASAREVPPAPADSPASSPTASSPPDPPRLSVREGCRPV